MKRPKHKPNGFVARCQCGVYVGALDPRRTDLEAAGKILGDWLGDGCTVEPRFDGTWSVEIAPCQCDTSEQDKG